MQIKRKISKVIGGSAIFPKNTRRLPKIYEDHLKTPENVRRSLNTPKISEDHLKTFKDFQRSHEGLRRCMQIIRRLPMILEDHPKTSDVFQRILLTIYEEYRRSLEYFPRFVFCSFLWTYETWRVSFHHGSRGLPLLFLGNYDEVKIPVVKRAVTLEP